MKDVTFSSFDMWRNSNIGNGKALDKRMSNVLDGRHRGHYGRDLSDGDDKWEKKQSWKGPQPQMAQSLNVLSHGIDLSYIL